MKCKEVLEGYHELVPFPLSPEKIAVAGYNVRDYLVSIGEDLAACEDAGRPAAQDIILAVELLRNLS